MKRSLKNLASSISVAILSALLIGSLGNNIVLAEETTSTSVTNTNKELTTEAKNLYYGYNITGGKSLMEADAIPKVHPIIDLNSDYPIKWTDFSGEQENKSFARSSFRELEKEFSLSVVDDTNAAWYVFSANLDVAFNMDRKVSNAYSEYYEMYSCRIEKGSYVVHDINIKDIRKYLSPKFVEDINNIRSEADAEAFFNTYGTHLSTGYKYGGQMNITNYKSTSDSSVQLNQGLSLETKISGAIYNVIAGKSISINETYGSAETTSETTSTYNFKAYGGEAVAGVNIDSLFTYNPSLTGNGKYEYGRWVDSINEGKNLAIIGVANGCSLIPVWELLEPNANPEIRTYLINVFAKMCGDKYEEYMNKYPSMNRSIGPQRTTESSSAPVIDGVFIKTKNSYLYYVDINDFSSSGGNHNELHEGDTLYLCISNPGSTNYEYVCTGCEVVDKRSGIFKVTGTKNDNVTIKYKDNNTETTLLSAPVKSCSFEGGSGTKHYPYLIANASQFQSLNNAKKDTYYQLIKDIDFKGTTIHPLGVFNGVLNGNYCSISNFKIEVTDQWGLFREIGESGEIKNLKISNAGTCSNVNEFSKSRLSLDGDNPVKAYAITASLAGILSAKNSGTISDCYITDCYLCNVDIDQSTLKSDPERKKDLKQSEMNTGLLVGENSGSIKGCKVKNSSVLGAYLNTGKINKDNIFVYTGGFVGKATAGSLDGCVLINDGDHRIYSFTANDHDANIFAAKNEVRTYAAGLIGYCDKNSSIRLENIYVQVSASSIDSSTKNYGVGGTKPNSYHHLKSIAVIASDKTLMLNNCYSYCEAKNNMHCYLIPGSKNADSIDSTKAYETNDEEFDKNGNSKISNSTNFYDSTYDYSGSLRHILEKNKSDHISLVLDDSDNNMKNVYCSGDKLTVNGLKLKAKVRDGDDYDGLIVFNVRLTENGVIKPLDTPLTSVGKDAYSVSFDIFEQSVACKSRITLEINENAIAEFALESKSDKKIYLDKTDEFVSSWSPDDISVTVVLSNGTRVTETDSKFAELVDKSKFELATSADDLAKGDNYIKVKYVADGNDIYSNYVVPVTERKVASIKIQAAPTKQDYQAGDRIDLSGIKVQVNYDQGPSDVCTDKNKLSVIGEVVSSGDNVIVVIYDGHLNCSDSFTISSVKAGAGSTIAQNNPNNPAKGIVTGILKVLGIILIVIVVIIVAIVVLIVVGVKRSRAKSAAAKSSKPIPEALKPEENTEEHEPSTKGESEENTNDEENNTKEDSNNKSNE